MSCAAPPIPRDDAFQAILRHVNPTFENRVLLDVESTMNAMRPDADMDLSRVRLSCSCVFSIQNHKNKKQTKVSLTRSCETQDLERSFHVAACPRCRVGFYKPKLVFFGDSVPKPVMDKVSIDRSIDQSIYLSIVFLYARVRIVSLTTVAGPSPCRYIRSALGLWFVPPSAFRIPPSLARERKRQHIAIGLVNIGPSRGDLHAHVKVNAKCSDVLTRLHLA